MDTYHPFPTQIPPLLARTKLAAQLLESLSKHNVSVVGRRHYGKSVLLSHIAGEARKSGRFDQVVEWDLRHFTPQDDGEFFHEMCRKIGSQLKGQFAVDAREFLSSKDEQTASTIRVLLEILEEARQVLLLVMDGMDDPLSSSGLSKGVWDHLCSFTDKGSLRILAGSRRRLRELCLNPKSRTSDFFRRFEDPPTVLGAFNQDELSEFLTVMEETRPLDKGARSEFNRQTGGIPILCASLARMIVMSGNGPVTQTEVTMDANALLADGSETIPAVWSALDGDEKAAAAELFDKGVLRVAQGKYARALTDLGLATESGGKLRSSCQLLAVFIGGQVNALCSLPELFGSSDRYGSNVQEVVRLRFKQTTKVDPDLGEFIVHAIARQDQPRVFLSTIRGIYEYALAMVWLMESPNQTAPKFTNSYALEFLQKCDGVGRLPSDTSKRLRCLELLTDPRNGVTPKKANRKIYCLLNSLKAYGDLGQHQQENQIGPGFAAVVCLTVVELANELCDAGF